MVGLWPQGSAQDVTETIERDFGEEIQEELD
jgi:hypothetical protein